jgi:hypothetical protein
MVLKRVEVFAVKTMKIYFMYWHCCLHYNYNVIFSCRWPLKCHHSTPHSFGIYLLVFTFLCQLVLETNLKHNY